MNAVSKYCLLAAWEQKLPILRDQLKLDCQGISSRVHVFLLPVSSESQGPHERLIVWDRQTKSGARVRWRASRVAAPAFFFAVGCNLLWIGRDFLIS